MKVDSIVIMRSFVDAIRKIRSPEERCKAYDAMFDYGLDHIESDLDDGPGIVMELIKPLLDNQYIKRMANAEKGRKGGRPRATASQSGEDPEGTEEQESQKKPSKSRKKPKKAEESLIDNCELRIGNCELNNTPPVSPSKGESASKKAFGKYGHVRLTDEQYLKLGKDYGTAAASEAVTFLDEYIQMKGYKAKDHNLAIRKWVFDAVEEEKQKRANRKAWAQNADITPVYDDSKNAPVDQKRLQELLERRKK